MQGAFIIQPRQRDKLVANASMADALVEPANDFFSVDDDPFGDDEFAAPPPSSPVEPVKTVPRRERWLKLLGLSESASTRDGYEYSFLLMI